MPKRINLLRLGWAIWSCLKILDLWGQSHGSTKYEPLEGTFQKSFGIARPKSPDLQK
jgi:hypothetical protein